MITHRHAIAAMLLTTTLPLAGAGLTRADDTGISGEVESLMELSLDQTASGRVTASVTSTVGGTRLQLVQGGSVTELGAFGGSRTNLRRVTRIPRTAAGSPDATITLGPQGP
ncbi:MAG: hypothetical protein QM679_11985 [Patulibacter sp.]